MQKNNNQLYKLRCEDENALMEYLKENKTLYKQFEGLGGEWRERFIGYCLGKKTLPVTYDPFFKRIFHPDIHQGRLSRLISSLLGIPVSVVKILSNEETLLDGGALLILDILVELEDGSLANVEVQKIPYLFPGERMSCYSADLVLRQYSRVKSEKNKQFKYSDLKKVYTIVIFEKSVSAFHEKEMHYLHKGKTVFDTGLELELLQEYCLLALDVFRKKPYPKDKSEQWAWIAFLETDSVETAEALMKDYPWLREIYEEMASYLQDPEEVLGMFSEALKIMDQNTVQYMIELQQQELDEAKEHLKTVRSELDTAKGELDTAKGELEVTKGELDVTKGELDAAQNERDALKGETDVLKAKWNKLLQKAVERCKKQGRTEDETVRELMEEYDILQSEALEAVKTFY